MFKSPCRNCPERRVEIGYNCHDHCEKYKTAIEDNKAQREYRREGMLVADYTHEKYRRRRRA